MSSFVIKIIAILSMLIDHVGAVLIKDPSAYNYRLIGRIAFPLFCFLLVQGFLYTRDVKKYLIRLAAFAIISEIPFDLALYGSFIYPSHQNVFFTLFIGLLILFALNLSDNYWTRKVELLTGAPESYRILQILCNIGIFFLGSYAAEWLHSDYGAFGVWLILVFYFLRGSKIALAVGGWGMFYYLTGRLMNAETLSLIFILSYNGKLYPEFMMKFKNNKLVKYGFYVFYPLHLFIIYLMRS